MHSGSVVHEDSFTCYVADVSGHGIAAGVLMGMFKTAARMALLRGAQLDEVLREAHGVLPGLKDPGSYVTFAGIRFSQSGIATYSTAGHGPIIRYRHETRAVERLGMEQFPVGLIPAAEYRTGTTRCSPGDVFVLLTDGIVEVASAGDEEFGLDRIERLLLENSARPLAELIDVLLKASRAHGPQLDDQTILLAKVIG